MVKFQREYNLQVQKTDKINFLQVIPPTTVEFDISRSTLQSSNNAHIRVFNLSQDSRNSIVRDDWINDTRDQRLMIFDAGYEGLLSTIFKGNLRRVSSVRQGVNFVTTIEAYDGGSALLNSRVDQSFQSGMSMSRVLERTLATFQDQGVTLGAIGHYPGVLARGITLNGNSADHAHELSSGGFFIDNGKAYCLNDNECIRGAVTTIDSSMGLLGTPVRERTKLTLEILFEPRIMMGQKITLKSLTAGVLSDGKNVNGEYKVVGIKHRGTISGAVCGDAITSLELFTGTALLSVIN